MRQPNHLCPILGIALALFPVACHAPTTSAPSRELAPEVQIFSKAQMEAFCSIDPPGLCKDFKTPSVEAVLYFEEHINELLNRRGLGALVPKIHQYLRQYWAYTVEGEVVVEGNFVCKSVVAVSMETPEGQQDPVDVEHPSAPVIVDDAGDCSVSVWFISDEPGSLRRQPD